MNFAVPLVLSLLHFTSPAIQEAQDTIRPIPLDAVVVQVLRDSERLSRTPASVSVIQGPALTDPLPGLSLQEILGRVPGLLVQSRYNLAVGDRVALRGFGARSQFGIRGIRIFVDGIPATLPDGQASLDHLETSSLGRVEVLRGPASSLYGNAAGGVLLFQTREPAATPLHQQARLAVGSHGMNRIQSTTSGSFQDAGYLVSLQRFGIDGFRPVGEGPGVYGAAERLQLNATAHAAVAGGELRAAFNILDLDAENPGSLARSALDAGQRSAFPFNVNQRTGKEISQLQGGLTWTRPLGALELEATTWGIRRQVRNPIPPAIIEVDRNAGGARAMLRGSLEVMPGGITWNLGSELELQDDDRRNFQNQQGNRGQRTVDQRDRVLGVGVFGQTRMGLAAGLFGLVGLRADWLNYAVWDERPTTAGVPDESGSRTLDAVSPSVGILWEASSGVQLFTNATSVFEGPTTTELANRPQGAGGFNPDLDPQKGRTVEAGMRGQAGGTFSWDVAVFQTRLTGELVPFEVPDAPGRTFFRNSGRSSRTGVELGVGWMPTPAVAGQLTYTGVNARFKEYDVGGQDFSGNRVPGLPPHRVEGQVRLQQGPWVATLQGEWVDAVPANDANSDEAAAYTLLGLRLQGGEVFLNGIRVAPFAGVENALDREYVSSVTVNAFGNRFFEPGPGRTFHLGLETSWPRIP